MHTADDDRPEQDELLDSRPGRRSPKLLPIVVAVAAVVLALGGWVLSSRHGHAGRPQAVGSSSAVAVTAAPTPTPTATAPSPAQPPCGAQLRVYYGSASRQGRSVHKHVAIENVGRRDCRLTRAPALTLGTDGTDGTPLPVAGGGMPATVPGDGEIALTVDLSETPGCRSIRDGGAGRYLTVVFLDSAGSEVLPTRSCVVRPATARVVAPKGGRAHDCRPDRLSFSPTGHRRTAHGLTAVVEAYNSGPVACILRRAPQIGLMAGPATAHRGLRTFPAAHHPSAARLTAGIGTASWRVRVSSTGRCTRPARDASGWLLVVNEAGRTFAFPLHVTGCTLAPAALTARR